MLAIWGLHDRFKNLYKQLQTTLKIILIATWKSKKALAKYRWDRTHKPYIVAGITSLGDKRARLLPLNDLSKKYLRSSLLIPILPKKKKCLLMQGGDRKQLSYKDAIKFQKKGGGRFNLYSLDFFCMKIWGTISLDRRSACWNKSWRYKQLHWKWGLLNYQN